MATPSLFDRSGGEPRVRALVDRFYDLMESDQRYGALREMHDADLTPMRVSLTAFLCGWLGGPRDRFAEGRGLCIMSLHHRLGLTPATAGQWLRAMGRAIEETGVDAAVATPMRQAFARMAAAMIANGDDED